MGEKTSFLSFLAIAKKRLVLQSKLFLLLLLLLLLLFQTISVRMVYKCKYKKKKKKNSGEKNEKKKKNLASKRPLCMHVRSACAMGCYPTSASWGGGSTYWHDAQQEPLSRRPFFFGGGVNIFPKLFAADVSNVVSDSVDGKKLTLDTSCGVKGLMCVRWNVWGVWLVYLGWIGLRMKYCEWEQVWGENWQLRVDMNVWRWFGHVERMDIERLLKKVMNANVDGRSARGRPSFGWMDGVKRPLNDMRMDIREARECARNRNEWWMIVTQF